MCELPTALIGFISGVFCFVCTSYFRSLVIHFNRTDFAFISVFFTTFHVQWNSIPVVKIPMSPLSQYWNIEQVLFVLLPLTVM